ncbi:hypothetical protein QBC42DRAFT_22047 [Cladorrhinum samala]|uniref:Uncharacterized protein n=1 Tax=Cladorrhinum samala TaxID=585594 RepID=A0AAV9HWW2_9PEZI|nr:hypothetical protein QBC42DRAFT_22047 [Cladorrhinum samala]
MMFERLKTHKHHVGGPMPVDSKIHMSIGYGTTRTATQTKGGYSYSIKGGPAPPRPPREFLESLEASHHEPTFTLPIREPPPRNPNRITVRAAHHRASSPVNSQFQNSVPIASNYTVTVATAKYGYRYGGADEISPPSSPEPYFGDADRYLPGDVSPIDEDDDLGVPHRQHTMPPATNGAYHDAGPIETGIQQTGQFPPRPPNNNNNNRAATNIPMMRREKRKQAAGAMAQQQQQQQQHPRNPLHTHPAQVEAPRDTPRWDPLTGEHRGRPLQIHPEFPQGLGITSHAWASPQSSPAVTTQSFTERWRRIAKKAAAVRDREISDTDPAAGAFTSSRPGWRGASGRTVIVDPIHDNPEVAPLRIPEKNSRRNVPPAQTVGSNKPIQAVGGALRRGETPPISPPAFETSARAGPREVTPNTGYPLAQQTPVTHLQSQNGRSYPSPPLSGNPLGGGGGGDAPSVAARELVRDGPQNVTALPSPTFNVNSREANALRRKLAPAHIIYQHQQGSVSSLYSEASPLPQAAPQAPPALALNIPDIIPTGQPPINHEAWVQPPSRFSITTYATSNTGTTREDGDEVIDEDQPPVPVVPAEFNTKTRHSSENSPVTSPIDQFMSSPFQYHQSEHPTMLAAANPAIARAQAVERPNSRASDVNKMLPPAPPEVTAEEAQDRVGMLRAQSSALANRRLNLERVITQMTEMMPTDKLINSEEVIRKREAEKKKLEALELELSEVKREEHELGLKLHRAYKRLDRETEWETTGLWVRRVTN